MVPDVFCDYLLAYNFCICGVVYSIFVFIHFSSCICGGKIRIPLRRGLSSLDCFSSALRSRKLCGNQNGSMTPGITTFKISINFKFSEFPFSSSFQQWGISRLVAFWSQQLLTCQFSSSSQYLES